LRELILKNPLTVMSQNEVRSRSGKFSKPIVSDLSIMWLLQAAGKTVHLVPVTINYERVFEINNLATEMVSGIQA
jgi:glycerol-3-phosphate O-acyltransferase